MRKAKIFLALIFIVMLPLVLSCGGGGGSNPGSNTTNYSGTWKIALNGGVSPDVIVFIHQNNKIQWIGKYTGITVMNANVNGSSISGTINSCTSPSISGNFISNTQLTGTFSLNGQNVTFTGTRIDNSTSTITNTNIPSAAITVDGNTNDWNGINPVITDQQNDKILNVSGGDLKAVYLSKSGNKLYLRFDVWTDNINPSNHYRLWFDNNLNGCVDGDVEDRQIDIYYSNGWKIAAQNMHEPHTPADDIINVNGVVVVSGTTIEASLDLDLLGLSNSFLIDSVIRDQNYNNIDFTDYSILINNPFTTSDLQGAWNLHILASGDSPQWIGWAYFTATIDNSGNMTFTSATRSDGDSSLPPSRIVSINSDGILASPPGDPSSFHGIMNQGKDLVIATLNDGGGGYDLLIMQKAGGTFTTADLQGTWNCHSLTSGDSPKWIGWAYFTATIDGNGNMNFTSVNRSDGDSSLPPSKKMSITSGGVITELTGDPSFHGTMNQNKDLIVATLNDGGGGYDLVIFQKAGGTFTTADFQGNWKYHGLVSGDAPAQKVGWFYGNWLVDSNGSITQHISYKDSSGLTTVPPGFGPFSINSSGVVTVSSPSSFYGVMNPGKDMVIFTMTGYPSLNTGVGGYVLGIILK